MPDAGLRITPPPVVGATLGAASILAVTEAGSASTSLLPEGLIHQASFQTPVAPAQSETGMLYARIGETVFQNAELVAAAAEANAISGILRTTHAYVDSSVVHVTFNLLDANKNLRVETSGLLVRLTLVASTGVGLQAAIDCDHSGVVGPANHYSGTCKFNSLDEAWFASSGTAAATLTVSYDGGSRVVANFALQNSLGIIGKPAWWGNLDSIANSAALFATLPASPVYALNPFPAMVYAHTGGQALSSFLIGVTYDTSKLRYIDYTFNPLYRSPQFATEDVGGGRVKLKYSVVGVVDDTVSGYNAVTNTALWLVTPRFEVLSGTATGAHSSSIFVVDVETFSNPMAVTILSNAAGFVLDSRNSQNSGGLITVRSPVDTGLFAYSPIGTLLNLAVLGQTGATYGITVVKTTDNPNHQQGAEHYTDVTSSATCASMEFTLSSCAVPMTSTPGIHSNGFVMVTWTSFSSIVELNVVVPSNPTISVGDPTLQRLADGNGQLVECLGGPHAYQWTPVTLVVTVGAVQLDVTPLVTFRVEDPGVGTIVPGTSILRGVGAGLAVCSSSGRKRAMRVDPSRSSTPPCMRPASSAESLRMSNGCRRLQPLWAPHPSPQWQGRRKSSRPRAIMACYTFTLHSQTALPQTASGR